MKKLKKKKYKIKWHNIITLLTILICLYMLVYSIIQINNWYQDTKKTDELMNLIIDNTKILEINDDKEEIIKDNPKERANTNLFDVDLEELKLINKDTIGWIIVNGTNINYPFVKHTNNEYYLTHSFDKSYNKAGWIFLDYRNNINILDKNTIIYAHGRVGNKMFGTLRTILESNWYLDENNYYIKLSLEKENMLFQVFSLYKIKNNTDYLQIKFQNDIEFINFINKLKERSFYSFNTNLNQNDKIITLSTCYNKDYKVVMHAKLIKKESFN